MAKTYHGGHFGGANIGALERSGVSGWHRRSRSAPREVVAEGAATAAGGISAESRRKRLSKWRRCSRRRRSRRRHRRWGSIGRSWSRSLKGRQAKGRLGEALQGRRERPRPSASTVGKRKGNARGRERQVRSEGELALGSALASALARNCAALERSALSLTDESQH